MKSVYLGFTLFNEKVLRKEGHCSNDFFKSYIFKMCDVSKIFKVVTDIQIRAVIAKVHLYNL